MIISIQVRVRAEPVSLIHVLEAMVGFLLKELPGDHKIVPPGIGIRPDVLVIAPGHVYVAVLPVQPHTVPHVGHITDDTADAGAVEPGLPAEILEARGVALADGETTEDRTVGISSGVINSISQKCLCTAAFFSPAGISASSFGVLPGITKRMPPLQHRHEIRADRRQRQSDSLLRSPTAPKPDPGRQ